MAASWRSIGLTVSRLSRNSARGVATITRIPSIVVGAAQGHLQSLDILGGGSNEQVHVFGGPHQSMEAHGGGSYQNVLQTSVLECAQGSEHLVAVQHFKVITLVEASTEPAASSSPTTPVRTPRDYLEAPGPSTALPLDIEAPAP